MNIEYTIPVHAFKCSELHCRYTEFGAHHVSLALYDAIYFFVQGAVSLKLAQDEHKNNEQDLRKNKRSLKVCC